MPNDDSFRPAQLATRHLLGAMAVVAVIAAFSASRLRELPAARAGEVLLHWAIVAVIAAGGFYLRGLRRRKEQKEAGAVQLRVLRRPMSERRRLILSWLLTALVVADGVVMSVLVLPSASLLRFAVSFPMGTIWCFVLQGGLWSWCLDHWLGNVYWIEFCENGVRTHYRYYPWSKVTRLGWSPARPGNLVMLHGGYHEEMTIDPASRREVDHWLADRQAASV